MEKENFDHRDITILIVDDEPRIRDLVRMNLELEHYHVLEASSGEEALEQLRENLPDLIVLDVMMPDMDGFETLRQIREVSTVPVIMLTVRQDEHDRIRGLDLGADDYIAKPFSPRELLSRIRALLRRAFMPPPARKTEIVVDKDLKIDFARREVIVRGQKVTLRPTEYRLLYHLVNNAGRLLTHETLLSKVWGREYRDEAHYLRLYITYLRQKIEKDPAHPQYILTERGVGYRFKELEG
ncbi:MAG: response regulator transcription factor [Thermogemmatispora sp.]|jgi:DNA-binding response OmpR family regulator|uniref:Transcriptional regulatory protein KdpE n=2 Tax=Thermogemmatispora TaxID=768669 RepID=A0A328VM98_9CHLR|nr:MULTISPECIES: response regulator transcription factor [Thermogemmatispora]MBE3564185.1 response regulator transcription factor [Thermogemmatispora sp.]RAQ96743.1 DNA-binding response regulator [Thermogemmatispora tikiterensis]GER84682.1 DNA-binding response regulator [Thermogemmatispora aurantia]